jgi:hypothetical protein
MTAAQDSYDDGEDDKDDTCCHDMYTPIFISLMTKMSAVVAKVNVCTI